MTKKKSKYLILFFVDIMNQITKEMCYFHDMCIIHCDLKHDDILANVMNMKIIDKIVWHAISKVIYFRTSTIKIEINLEINK